MYVSPSNGSSLLTLSHSLSWQMNKSIPPDEPSYGEVDADHIIYAFFQMYTYTEDDEITPDDQENRRYLEKIGAWVCTGPTGLERGMQEMKVNDPVGSSSS